MAKVELTPVESTAGSAQGLVVEWDGGQFVTIVTPKGMVGCGIFDMKVCEKFGMAVAIARGTPEHPLRVPDDVLKAKVLEVTPRAQELGVRVGMSGKEALEILS